MRETLQLYKYLLLLTLDCRSENGLGTILLAAIIIGGIECICGSTDMNEEEGIMKHLFIFCIVHDCRQPV